MPEKAITVPTGKDWYFNNEYEDLIDRDHHLKRFSI
jgi:hypothetical protein